ncbi:hypothetical protein KPSA1_01730 [Pseudomonas syringae pv. actinidiae]|uniref:Uncharacterized protein n=1 Tax=Pseudomonas syringae pv. actinidiae TaxID=103796 RepID=A0A2V0Q6G8_PSESF|nr:hypothetical protein KPSA1_01730 [Pseudomonas syringae pv. actinidiae]
MSATDVHPANSASMESVESCLIMCALTPFLDGGQGASAQVAKHC